MLKTDLSSLSINQLFELTGRTPRTIKEKLRGVEPVGKDGRAILYNPREALPLILGVEKLKDANTPNLILQDEKARLASAQADKTELEVKKIQGDLLPVAEVERAWTKMSMNFRAKVLVIPARLSAQLAGMKSPQECKRLLKETLHQALEELSADGAEQLDEEFGEEGGEEAGATAESESERVVGSRKSSS